MAKKDGKLTERQKVFLVQRFALFDSPKLAADALEKEHGVRITRQSAERYDPGTRAGSKMAPHLRAVFDATRKAFLASLDDIAISHLAVRLRRLDRMQVAAEERGNYVLAAALIEQAAKEIGGSFTNRREVSGRDGKPFQFQDVSTMTPQQLDDELRQHMKNPALRDWVLSLGEAPEATPAPAPMTKQ